MSALTSLLVRDDAVSVRQIEEALARQLVDGGELDTALLELGAIAENKLIAYRAASERGQPARREEVMGASASTVALLPSELALSLQVAPLFHDEKTLTVACVRPLKPAEIAQLSERTGMQITVRITVELRVLAALERFYGHALEPRLAVLLNKVDAQPAGELQPVAPLQASARAIAAKTEQLPAFEESEDFQAVLAAAFERASMSPAAGTQAVDPEETRPLSQKRAFGVQRKRGHASDTARIGTAVSGTTNRVSSSVRPSPAVVSRPQAPARRNWHGSSSGVGPELQLTAAEAQELLSRAEERDAVIDLFFRFAKQFFDATVLFTVKDGRVLGAQAHNAKALFDVREVSLQIARGSALDELTRTLLARVIDLGRKDEDRPLAAAVKRLDSQPAALVPVCIKRRVVSVLYGDRSGEPLHLDELTELLALMPHVTSAFERIIRARKALGAGSPSMIGELLSHAPTQRSIPVPPQARSSAPPALANLASALAPQKLPSFGAESRTGEMNDNAKQALEALKIPRVMPSAKAFLPEEDADIYATARIPIQPLPLDQFESPPRLFSKPPPGAGRYQSLAPKHAGAEEILRPPHEDTSETRSSTRPPAAGSDDPRRTAPGVRKRPSARPAAVSGQAAYAAPRHEAAGGMQQRAVASQASQQHAPASRAHHAAVPANPARRTLPPAAVSQAPQQEVVPHQPPARSSKPAPGSSGLYHNHVGTTELIGATHARHAPRDEAHQQDSGSNPGGFFLRSEPRPPANHNEPQRAGLIASNRVATHPPSPPPPRGANRPAASAPPSTTDVAQLVDQLCRAEVAEEPPQVKALLALGEPALSMLLTRFPGRLWFDRRKPHARVPLARDISPICRALDAFGDQVTERLIPLLGSNSVEVRYYATLFACDRVRPGLLEPLLTRLFDDDPQIRLLVRDALPHYRKFPGFERVTERLCEKARSEDTALYERLAALDAISVLRDPGSVSTLIELIVHRDKQISVPAHRALSLITCQDFGKTPRKWRSWYSDNSDRHRVEWLIDGLMHSDESTRATAGLELQKLTQVYYGYVAAASKREREAAQKRYVEWWQTEGRARLTT